MKRKKKGWDIGENPSFENVYVMIKNYLKMYIHNFTYIFMYNGMRRSSWLQFQKIAFIYSDEKILVIQAFSKKWNSISILFSGREILLYLKNGETFMQRCHDLEACCDNYFG